jgi:hypothetical protein
MYPWRASVKMITYEDLQKVSALYILQLYFIDYKNKIHNFPT